MPPRMPVLSVMVPCTDSRYLRDKLRDCEKLSGVEYEVIVCYNGRANGLREVREIVEGVGAGRTLVCSSEPFNKNEALRAGLAVARSDRILYSDVDCLMLGEPDPVEVRHLVSGAPVVSFPVLRRAGRASCILAILKRTLFSEFYRGIGLHYLSVRGGGYLCGNYARFLRRDVYHDDMLYPLEFAESSATWVQCSDVLVFYERAESARDYVRKIPRLVYGSLQAARLTRYRRVRLSIVIQKHVKYFVFAFSPVLAVLVVLAVGLPPAWGALSLLPWRALVGTWQGILAGLAGRPPGWGPGVGMMADRPGP